MANLPISGLTASASNLASTDLAPVVQTVGVGPVKMTGLQLAGGLLGSTTFNGATSVGTALSTVAITGTGGQFSCAAATLAVGQNVTISGTLGGTGSITGYSSPTTYTISATNGSTTFTLVNASTGAALTTTAGTPTGLTYVVTSPVVNFTQTWNNSNVKFTGLKFNATDTASASGSLLLDLQVGGTSQFSINKTGLISLPTTTTGTPTNAGFGTTSQTLDVYAQGTQIARFMTDTFRLGNKRLGFQSAGLFSASDVFLFGPAPATLQLGAADAAAPVAQTLQVQSVVAGTLDTAGATFTIRGSASTGDKAGGSIVFTTSNPGTSGTSLNTPATRMIIYGSSNLVELGNNTVFRVPFGVSNLGGGAVIWGQNSLKLSTDSYPTASNVVDLVCRASGILNVEGGSTTTIRFGGSDATFPALRRSSTTLQVRLGDNTAFAPLACSSFSQTAGTLADGANAYSLTATMPASPTGTMTGVSYTVTSAGSASQQQLAAALTLAAGYTGGSATTGLVVTNSTTGTANGYAVAGSGASYRVIANRGINSVVNGSTAGINVGVASNALGSATANYGVWGSATLASNNAWNVGVAGFGLNTGTGTQEIGGFFALYDGGTSAPNLVSAALVADNGTSSNPIFLARDNASTVFTIANGGAVTTTSSIQTGAPTGGTAGAWKLGSRVAATTVLDTTQYIEVDVGGTLYKLAVVTS